MESPLEKELQLTSKEIYPGGMHTNILRNSQNQLRFINYADGISLEYNPLEENLVIAHYLSQQATSHEGYKLLIQDTLQDSYGEFNKTSEEERDLQRESQLDFIDSSFFENVVINVLNAFSDFIFRGATPKKELEEKVKCAELNYQEYLMLHSALEEGKDFVYQLKERYYQDLPSVSKNYLDFWLRNQEEICVGVARLAETSKKEAQSVRNHLDLVYSQRKINRSPYL
ncbi:MAG TPA: hypothetical protein PLK34_02425 [Candidatus Pacearchaeota archaeon]|nr:hypothetical protein [Candidatus Pacearchaeota archaeon]